jgi:hypothetical protein
VTSAAYDANQNPFLRVAQAGQHNVYDVPFLGRYGGLKLSACAYPSQKVHVHDQHARHFGRHQAFFAYPSARVVLLFMDASASVRMSQNANVGWFPKQPELAGYPNIHHFLYNPLSTGGWEPETLSGAPQDLMTAGYYRWTRGLNQGVDFNGNDIWTGQPLP